MLEPLPGLTLGNHVLGEQAAQFELTLDTTERPDGQVGALFSYAAELFEPATIERLGAHYLHLLQQLAEHPERILGDIDILSGEEKAQLKAWGVNEQRYADAEPVHRLIERQVEACPEAVALIFGDTELSYAELNRRANRLAHRLIALGVKARDQGGHRGGALDRDDRWPAGDPQGWGCVCAAGPGVSAGAAELHGDGQRHWLAADAKPYQGAHPASGACVVLELDTLDVSGEAAGNPAIPVHGGQSCLCHLYLRLHRQTQGCGCGPWTSVDACPGYW